MPSIEARLRKLELASFHPSLAHARGRAFDQIRDRWMSDPLRARDHGEVDPCEILFDVLSDGGLGWPVAEFKTRFPNAASRIERALDEVGMRWDQIPVRKERPGPLRFDPEAARASSRARQAAWEKRAHGVPWKKIISAMPRRKPGRRAPD